MNPAFRRANVSNIPDTKCLKHFSPKLQKMIKERTTREVTKGVTAPTNVPPQCSRQSLRTKQRPKLARSAAHKMHDFQLVAIAERRGSPLAARNKLAVQFHGNTVRLHFQMIKQRRQSGDRAEFAVVAVNG